MENWKRIPEWPWYEVSDHGRVRSVDRVVVFNDGRVRPYKGQILKCTPGSAGYPLAKLRCENCEHKMVPVHVLVARVFIGPRPSRKHEVRHLNDKPLDCHVSNLAYGTSRQNKLDIKINRPSSPLYVLTIDQVREIKEAQKTPYIGQGVYLADKYGISDRQISSIKHGRCHSEIIP